ncbi:MULTISPECIES: hypothetical protein [Nocardia]|uniref:Uncharacterized protein n=1 Tax=Nocardia arthritidis TaxID=228602 RepID=A0A6G9YCD1_9NOCA|nr:MULTISPECIES: hypothetical protein [Nocardia]QIS10881.1 hypothetical protein F5544_14985 [Nocardia arthritidis]
MNLGWIEVAVVAIVLALRLLATGWLLKVSVLSFGVVPALVLGPLIGAGFAATHITHPALFLADGFALFGALLFPDFGDPDEYQVPLLMLLRGDPALSAGSRFGTVLFVLGGVGFTGYAIGLAVTWIQIGLG